MTPGFVDTPTFSEGGIAVSPNGKAVYVTEDKDSVAQNAIDRSSGALTPMTPATVPPPGPTRPGSP